MRKLVAILACAALASTALAADDWGFVSTSGSPDTAYSFDLANPGVINALGPVQGNFNRGMEFDSPNTFYYYVSTDTLNDPNDRGLWYWDNGTNTQLYENSFQDNSDGDLALSNDGLKAYITVDEDPGVALYVYEGLNGGPITLTRLGATGASTNFHGLAMHPVTGKLYGVNGGDDSLYALDTTNGSAALIGALGPSLRGVGGMDFSPDGSTLLYASGSADYYKIDVDTGLASLAGDSPQNISALSYRVPEPATALMLIGLALFRRR